MITLSLCMIVKDEEDVLGRCIDSVKSIVDEIIIVDTGSVDATKDIAKSYTDKVYDFKWIDDFSAARNFSFSKATKDYILWLDADDVILENDRIKLKKLKYNIKDDVDLVMLKYNVAFDKGGRPTFSYYRERILKRDMKYMWTGEIHEVIELYGNIIYEDIAVTHKKIKANTLDRNLRIYEKIISSGKELDSRQEYYYAKELFYNNKIDKAIERLINVINSSDAWVENKISACDELAHCYLIQNKKNDALIALLRSFEFDEPRAEICCEIGLYFMNENEHKKAIFWYKLALTREVNLESGGFKLLDCYGYIPYIQLCVCYDHLNQKEKAIEYNEKAGIIKPYDEAFLYNKRYFEQND